MYKKGDNQSLDFLFINGGITLGPNGGYEVTYKIASGLEQRGYSVGIMFVRDIFRQILRYYQSDKLKMYVNSHLRYSIFSNLVNNRFGWIPKRFIRAIKNIRYEENFGQVNVFFSDGTHSPKSEIAIANGWHDALILERISNVKKKYVLALQDDADPRWNPELHEIAEFGLSLGFPIISVNSKVTNKYGSMVRGQIPLAIDHSVFYCSNPPENRSKGTVLMPLRSSRYKGSELGLEILRKIHNENPNVKLTSFGDIPKSLIPPYVEYHGVVTSSQLSSLYNEATVFILPSLVEGFGLTALEAMACGSMVVSTDNEGVREFLKNEINGIIVKEFDPEKIGSTVVDILKSDNKRVNIAKNGVSTALKYTTDSMVESFLNLVREN